MEATTVINLSVTIKLVPVHEYSTTAQDRNSSNLQFQSINSHNVYISFEEPRSSTYFLNLIAVITPWPAE